ANYAMIEVLRNLGMRVSLRRDAEVSHVLVDLEQPGVPQERYADAVLDRTVQADLRSLRSVLEPRSVAVIGAGRRPGSVGRAVLRSIVCGAFAGDLHVVHPR